MSSLAQQFQDQFTASRGETPKLSLRKRSFFQGGYYVMATWSDGTCLKVARFGDRGAAQYWIDVEGEDWTERCARLPGLDAMAAA